MKRMNQARAAGARVGASARAIEQLKAWLKERPRLSAEIVAEKLRQNPYQEIGVPGDFRALFNLEAAILLLGKEGERMAVVRCAEDFPGLCPTGAPYGADLIRKAWMIPEQEEQPREFLRRVFAAHKLDILVVHNAKKFARLCSYSSFKAAEPLWSELAALAAAEKCQVAIIQHEGSK